MNDALAVDMAPLRLGVEGGKRILVCLQVALRTLCLFASCSPLSLSLSSSSPGHEGVANPLGYKGPPHRSWGLLEA